MSLAGSDHHVTDRTVTDAPRGGRGRWRPGRPGDRLLPRPSGARLHDPGSGRRAGGRVARALGLAASCSRRPATTRLPGPARSRATRTATPTRDEVVGLPDRLCPSLRAAGRARQPRPLDPHERTAATWSSSTTAPTRPTRWWSPPGPFQVPLVPADRRAARRRRWCSSTAAPTERREPIPDGPVLVVGGGNTGFQIAEELSGLARGPPVDRLAADAAAAAHPRPRPVLVPRRDRPDPQDDGRRGSGAGWPSETRSIGSSPRGLRRRTASSSTGAPSTPRDRP